MRLDIERLFDDPAIVPSASVHDSRFRRLLARRDWDRLEPAIQRRFSKRVQGADCIVYRGEVVVTRMSACGWLLTRLCRTIGAPLPLHTDAGASAVVIVSEDEATGGQRWTRVYHRRGGNPQIIVSAKAFGGPTGLEEHVGGRIGMALRIVAAASRLRFVSDHYFVRLGAWRLRLPDWLTPGRTVVTHRDLGNGRFAFELRLTHRLFGELVYQSAIFKDE